MITLLIGLGAIFAFGGSPSSPKSIRLFDGKTFFRVGRKP